MANVAAAISMELRFVPRPRDFRSASMPAPSFVRTTYIPRIDRATPIAAITIGASIAFICASTPTPLNAAAPRAMVARMEPQYDS